MRRLEPVTEEPVPKKDNRYLVVGFFQVVALALGITFTILAAFTAAGTVQTTYIVLAIVFYVLMAVLTAVWYALVVVRVRTAYMLKNPPSTSAELGAATSRGPGSHTPGSATDPIVKVFIYGSVAFVALLVALIFLLLALSTPVGTLQTLYIAFTVIYFSFGGLLVLVAVYMWKQPRKETFATDLARGSFLFALLFAGLGIFFAVLWGITAVGVIQTSYIVFTFVFFGVAALFLGGTYYAYTRKSA